MDKKIVILFYRRHLERNYIKVIQFMTFVIAVQTVAWLDKIRARGHWGQGYIRGEGGGEYKTQTKSSIRLLVTKQR